MSHSKRRIYLDYNANAPLLPEARDALIDALDHAGNPSSVHAEGRRARSIVEAARRQVAALVGADAQNVVFTSGASEGAATCLAPIWSVNGVAHTIGQLAVLETDHPCIREGGHFDPASVTRLPVDAAGSVRLDALKEWLKQLPLGELAMLAFTLANSETGVVQPIGDIRETVAGRDVLMIVDMVQAAGRLFIELEASGADAMILSGHKMGGATGAGAIVLAGASTRPHPLVTGGGQEKGRRSGTEAVAAIASFGAAAQTARDRLASEPTRLLTLRHMLEAGLDAIGSQVRIVGAANERLPNTVSIHCSDVRAETAQIVLDLAGIAVSAGSACSSGKVGPSHVLAAMRAGGAELDPETGAIRVSFGDGTEAADIEAFLAEYGRLLRGASGAASSRAAA